MKMYEIYELYERCTDDIINCVPVHGSYQIRYRIACFTLEDGSKILTKPGEIRRLEDKENCWRILWYDGVILSPSVHLTFKSRIASDGKIQVWLSNPDD